MRKFTFSIFSGLASVIINIIVSLLITPYALKYLSKGEFALFYLLNNLTIWLGIITMGQKGSFKIQLASNIKNPDLSNRLFNTFLFFQIALVLFIILLGFCISHFVNVLFEIHPYQQKTAQITFLLLIASFSLSLLSDTFSNILSVHNRDYLIFSGRSVFSIIQGIILVILLNFGLKISALAISILISESAFLIYTFILVHRIAKTINIRSVFFDWNLLKKMLSYGKWFSLGFFAQLLIKHTDLILIEKLISLDTVTAFILTSKLYIIAFGVVQMVMRIASPRLVRISQSSRFLRISLGFVKFMAGIIVTAGLSIYIINEAFLNWWLGGKYFLGENINLLLLLTFFVNSFNLILKGILTSQLSLKGSRISTFIEGTVNLTLSILLGYYFGLPGIIGATLIAGFFISNIYLSYSSLSLFSKRLIPYIKKEAFLISVYILFSLLISFILSNYVFSSSFKCFPLVLAIIAVFFLILFLKDLKKVVLLYDKE